MWKIKLPTGKRTVVIGHLLGFYGFTLFIDIVMKNLLCRPIIVNIIWVHLRVTELMQSDLVLLMLNL